MPGRGLGVGALALALVTGLTAVSIVGASPPPRSAAGNATTVTCEDAAGGRADPKWRKRSTVTGPFGFYGDGRNFRKWAWKNNKGFFISKVPSILEGNSAVTVVIAARDADRAGLSFGTQGGYTLDTSFSEVRYEPCLNRSPTGWPGGFVLANRKPVRLFVQVEGESNWTRIVVGKSKRR